MQCVTIVCFCIFWGFATAVPVEGPNETVKPNEIIEGQLPTNIITCVVAEIPKIVACFRNAPKIGDPTPTKAHPQSDGLRWPTGTKLVPSDELDGYINDCIKDVLFDLAKCLILTNNFTTNIIEYSV